MRMEEEELELTALEGELAGDVSEFLGCSAMSSEADIAVHSALSCRLSLSA